MPRRTCLACSEVGGARSVSVVVERAGVLRKYDSMMCITCLVGMSSWLQSVSFGSMETLPELSGSAAIRAARRNAKNSKSWKGLESN
jgi:hypothetical protein